MTDSGLGTSRTGAIKSECVCVCMVVCECVWLWMNPRIFCRAASKDYAPIPGKTLLVWFGTAPILILVISEVHRCPSYGFDLGSRSGEATGLVAQRLNLSVVFRPAILWHCLKRFRLKLKNASWSKAKARVARTPYSEITILMLHKLTLFR